MPHSEWRMVLNLLHLIFMINQWTFLGRDVAGNGKSLAHVTRNFTSQIFSVL